MPQFRDWAITATFYAAVHLVEASFTFVPDIGHSETAKDRDRTEIHLYRVNKVRELAKPAHLSYKKLLTASKDVRYLKIHDPDTALSFYSLDDAKLFLLRDLPLIRAELEAALKVNLS